MKSFKKKCAKIVYQVRHKLYLVVKKKTQRKIRALRISLFFDKCFSSSNSDGNRKNHVISRPGLAEIRFERGFFFFTSNPIFNIPMSFRNRFRVFRAADTNE